jgi:hypothetical protein
VRHNQLPGASNQAEARMISRVSSQSLLGTVKGVYTVGVREPVKVLEPGNSKPGLSP